MSVVRERCCGIVNAIPQRIKHWRVGDMMRERKQAASFTDVLRAELEAISRQRASRSDGAKAKELPSVDDPVQAAHRAKLTGLAFSGGGIRSATFNLGVLQGLAKLGLLPSFDYLS